MENGIWESIGALASALKKRRFSAVELTDAFIKRIEANDNQTNAILNMNPDAIKIAMKRDKDLAKGAILGPLHGIPVMVKDNINTSDQMPTTAGSLALQENFAKKDAFLVNKLRLSGAIILAKTNLSEWANFRSVRSVTGWSSAGGQSRNPYALDRTPGGSSSGSGVAASCGYCPAAIGTETSGSIVNPAAMNGVVGIKPTVGLISRTGIVPISFSQDTAGPLARSVADAARILTILAGTDHSDPKTENSDKLKKNYCNFLNDHGLKGKRIGLAINYCGFDERVDRVIEESISAIKYSGADVIETELVAVSKIREFEFEVLLHEFKTGINQYLSGQKLQNKIRNLTDLIEFNVRFSDTTMPYFPQDIFEMAIAKDDLECRLYKEAMLNCQKVSRKNGIDKTLKEKDLDAIMLPTAGLPWLIDFVNGDNRRGTSAAAAAVAGYPNISVPAGYIYGLPVNISFVGKKWSEAKLIEIASGFEKVSPERIEPKFQNSAEIIPYGKGCVPSNLQKANVTQRPVW